MTYIIMIFWVKKSQASIKIWSSKSVLVKKILLRKILYTFWVIKLQVRSRWYEHKYFNRWSWSNVNHSTVGLWCSYWKIWFFWRRSQKPGEFFYCLVWRTMTQIFCINGLDIYWSFFRNAWGYRGQRVYSEPKSRKFRNNAMSKIINIIL